MKAIMVMFDSLNLRHLSTYGCDWVKTPNFERLAKKSVQFSNHYVGSMPCMPARRELHTGRYNFLHRSWGPIEPFDDSMPEILSNNGIYTHLISDHQHYWEDGGATYHTRYDSWEMSRGQEGDPWKADLSVEPTNTAFSGPIDSIPEVKNMKTKDAINRKFIDGKEENFPQAVTFKHGLEFIETNAKMDNWFLQIETFDPHEPFYVPDKYKEMYPDDYKGPEADWPPYYFVTEDQEVIDHTINNYAALVTMCDTYLGKVLDIMDEKNLWEDTMLIVNTDHGFLLGEHGWWAKTAMPMFNEIAHIPLYIYDPVLKIQNEVRHSLTQSVDLTATILDFFGLEPTERMQSRTLRPVIEKDEEIRDYALFGDHNKHINVTDGKHVYMRSPHHLVNGPSFEYTLMPTHMRARFSIENELRLATLSDQEFSFSKGAPLLKIPSLGSNDYFVNFGTLLFDVENDENQKEPLSDLDIELKMTNLLLSAMHDTEAPKEQYERVMLPENREATIEDLIASRKHLESILKENDFVLQDLEWTQEAKNMYRALDKLNGHQDNLPEYFEKNFSKESRITETHVINALNEIIDEERRPMTSYFIMLSGRVN